MGNMNMKRVFTLCGILFILLLSGNAFAQNAPKHKHHNNSRWKEYMTQKKEFLIKEVGMTDEEQKKFFPLYDELQQKKFDIQCETRREIRTLQEKKGDVSESDYLKIANAINNSRLTDAQLDNDYYRKFSRLVSAEKLYKLQVAELRVNKEILKKSQGRQEDKRDAGCTAQ